ncbi:MAG: hypothetical protein WBP34_06075 [Thermoanaerobaculia bacterium]
MKGVLIDDRLEVALGVDAPFVVADSASVERVLQHLAEALRAHLVATLGSQAQDRHLVEHLALRVIPLRVQLEGPAHQRSDLGIGLDGLAAIRPVDVSVAERRREGPAAPLESLFHAQRCLLRSLVVVELCDRREHAFHQLTCGRFIDGLGNGSKRHPQTPEVGPHRVVVVAVSGETIERVDEQHIDAPEVLAAVVEEVGEFRPVC